MDSNILRLYRLPAFSSAKISEILTDLQKKNPKVKDLQTEICYHVEYVRTELTSRQYKVLKWVLRSPFEREAIKEQPHLADDSKHVIIIEVGPRFNFSTSNSTNAIFNFIH